MSDILCIYYSRTGNTQRVMEEIASSLDAESVRIRDGVERNGWRGFLRCGMDAMRKDTAPLLHFETDRPLEDYRLVIVGSPVWAGRCSSVTRAFLKTYGKRLGAVSYVVTRSGEGKFEDIFRQMDQYVKAPHKTEASLRLSSVGYDFWREEFLRQTRDYLAGEQPGKPGADPKNT